MVPGGYSQGAGHTGLKNPDAPLIRARLALIWFCHCRTASLLATNKRLLQSQDGLAVTRSQKVRSLSTRASGALPAISAPLMARIEMPAIQSGWRSASVNAS